MVYITGDMHGDPDRLTDPALHRLRKGDTLLVCGDFGFIWDGGAAEQKFLKKLEKKKFTIAFVDGRHENFDLLADYPTVEWNGAPAQQINSRLYRLLRGQVYTVEGKTFFTFGGGESDDKDFRVAGRSWWPAELPTTEEMVQGRDNLAAHGNRVDYILTHMPSLKSRARLDTRASADAVSIYLASLEDAVTCRRWYFGCLHMDKALSAQRRAVFRDIIPVED